MQIALICPATGSCGTKRLHTFSKMGTAGLLYFDTFTLNIEMSIGFKEYKT